MNEKKIALSLNILELFAICIILTTTLYLQFFENELPCPLCILQRFGFLTVAFALMLNLIYGPKPSHYGLAIFGSLLTTVFATRQILLHIVPGTGEYGSPLFSLHLYTWTLLICIGSLLYIALMLMLDKQFILSRMDLNSRKFSLLIKMICYFLIFLCLINGISTFLECGMGPCPDNPVSYQFL